MPTPSYELTRLDSNTFEHLANMLALKVLGSGHTGFGPGPDGGRDGYLEGSAPYPTTSENWSGVWYIQSKFLAPHLSKDQHKWLLEQIKDEIKIFTDPSSNRVWPDNWIIVTNVDPSGAPNTGSFDQALTSVTNARPQLAKHFHIWGGRKVLDLLALNPVIADYYGAFVTPGQVLSRLYEQALDSHAQIESIVRYLIVTQFNEQQYTKLEQAGSTTDNRPGIQRLFTDVPFISPSIKMKDMAAATLTKSLSQNHRFRLPQSNSLQWKDWHRNPARARIWFLKGGPGQGKSTLTQYVSQIQRAALIRSPNGPSVTASQKAAADEIHDYALQDGLWPITPRVPVVVDLKEFAHWFGQDQQKENKRIIAYLARRITSGIGETVKVGTLKRAFGSSRWLFIFDGLDEVPGDVKDAVASEVTHFVDDMLVGCDSDAAIVCTSRPQGYSGQFAGFDASIIELVSLSPDQALRCAMPLLSLDRSEEEQRNYAEILKEAIRSPAIAEIMTTPLQAHIMAVIVRDGGKPPERKWQLFDTFYKIIKKREANRNLPDRKLAKLLREGDKLLKALHNRLGFELHARAEISQGAVTSLARNELKTLVKEVVSQLQEYDIDETVDTLMRATTDRLVLVSTPENGEFVRFDIRPLQEFFAAEHIYESNDSNVFVERAGVIAGDSHWREVMHFLMSALVENNRRGELAAAVTVLVQIDDSQNQYIRTLNRRLARGGIIAARLLQEGVLEQDKRIRELFRNCFNPLFGCIDANSFLTNFRANHSRNWLIDVLVANLKEQQEPEAIGSAISLADFLTDGDPRSSGVGEVILNATVSFQAFFFESLGYKVGSERKERFPNWIVKIALQLLLKDDWWRLGASGVRGAIAIVGEDRETLSNVAMHLGMGGELTSHLVSVLVSDERPWLMSDKASFSKKQYGIIETSFYKLVKGLEWKSWSKDHWAALETSTGIMRSAYLLFVLVRSPGQETEEALLASVGGTFEGLNYLPGNLKAFLSTRDRYRSVNRVSRPHEIVERERPGYAGHIAILPREKETDVDWVSFARYDPWLFLHVILSEGYVQERRLAQRTRSVTVAQYREIIRNVSSVEGCLLSFADGWGKIFSFPETLGNELRKLAVRVASGTVELGGHVPDILPFSLRLPEECDLFPHILNVSISRSTRQGRWYKEELSDIGSRQRTVKLVTEYVPSSGVLKVIAHDKTLKKRVRGAALVLSRFHSDSTVSGSKVPLVDDFVEFYEPAESEWYLPAVALLLSGEVSGGQADALETIGRLLDRAGTDYKGRRPVNSVLKTWREIAAAPVQRLNLPPLWL